MAYRIGLGRSALRLGTLLAEGFWRAVLAFLVKNGALSEELRQRMRAWRHAGFSAHNEVKGGANLFGCQRGQFGSETLDARRVGKMLPSGLGLIKSPHLRKLRILQLP